LPLGRFGDVPVGVTFAPFAGTAWIDRPIAEMRQAGGWFPFVGVGAITFFDLLRVDVARGLRGGRWAVYVDVTRDLWPIL
jgi:hypothetical protein